jgi:hypothetical protein
MKNLVKKTQAQYSYAGNAFHYTGIKTKKGWSFKFSVLCSVVNTSQLPLTHQILHDTVPGVLRTECFNYDDVPFSQEVKQTEIGHLFEHILLYLLLEAQMANGFEDAIYEGRTSWNWKKQPRGTFTISIWGPQLSDTVFGQLVTKTNQVLETILSSVPAPAVVN